jgi:hypothetical protein
MLGNWKNLDRSLLSSPQRPVSRRREWRLEALEARWVPAAIFTWTGNDGNGEWADGNNWTGGDGMLGHVYPNILSDVAVLAGPDTIKYENWTSGGVTNVVSNVLGGLETTNVTQFRGTLSLKTSLELTDHLTWSRGTINFNNAANTLQLDGGSGSTWSGGQIGDGDATGLFKLNNATLCVCSTSSVTLGVPTGMYNSTVTVSSSVAFQDSIVVTAQIYSGTLEFGGGTPSAPVGFGPDFKVPGDYLKSSGGTVTFDDNAHALITAGMWNSGATVQFNAGATVDVVNATNAIPAGNTPCSYFQDSGTTILGTTGASSGATLTCDEVGFSMNGGNLKTYSTAKQTISVGSGTSRVLIDGGTVTIGADLTGENFGWLNVDGNLSILGGTFNISVDLADPTKCSQLTQSSSGTF